MNIINLLNHKKYDKAFEIANKMLEKGNEEGYIILAEIYYRMYLDTGYEIYLKKASKKLEKINTDKDKLFSIYLMLGDYEKCKEIINEVSGELKQFLIALFNLEVKKDISDLKHLVENSTGIVDAYIIYSKILYQEGNYGLAKNVLMHGFKVTKSKTIKKELNLLKALLNVEKPIILKCKFKNLELISKELIKCKSSYEFIDMIGLSYEKDHIEIFIPYSEKLFPMIKDKIINIFYENVSIEEIEKMLKICESEVKR